MTETDGLIVRPRTSTRYCVVIAVVVFVSFVAISFTLRARPAGAAMGTADQFALATLGLLVALGILLPAWPRVIIDASGIRSRGFVGGYRYTPWQAIRDVRFRPRGHWPVVVLDAEEIVPLYALQRADGERSVQAMAQIRSFLATV